MLKIEDMLDDIEDLVFSGLAHKHICTRMCIHASYINARYVILNKNMEYVLHFCVAIYCRLLTYCLYQLFRKPVNS